MKIEASVAKGEVDPQVPPDSQINQMAGEATLTLGGKVFSTGLDFFRLALIARLLGVEAFGLFAIAWNFLRIISILLPLGMHNGVIHFGSRYWSERDGRFNHIVKHSSNLILIVSLLTSTAIFLLAPWLGETVFQKPDLVPIFRWFVWMLPFMAVLRVVSAATRVSKKMRYSVLATDVIPSLVNLLVFLLLYFLSENILSAVIAYVVAFAAGLSVAVYYLYKLTRIQNIAAETSPVSAKTVLIYSLPTAFAGFFGILMSRVDRVLIGYFRPAADVGIYQAASQFAIVFAIILFAFNTVLTPFIAHLYHKKNMTEMEAIFQVNTKWGIYVSIPVFLTLVFVPQALLQVVFGSIFVVGASALVILAIGQMVNASTGAVGVILTMTGRQKRWFAASVIMFVFNVLLNVLLIPNYGFVGAAIATTITVSVLYLYGLLAVRYSLRIWPYDRRYVKGLVAAGMTTLVLAAWNYWIDWLPVLMVTGTAVFAVTVFAGTLLLLGLDEEDREFLHTLRSRIG